jgi:hypothetical protein
MLWDGDEGTDVDLVGDDFKFGVVVVEFKGVVDVCGEADRGAGDRVDGIDGDVVVFVCVGIK